MDRQNEEVHVTTEEARGGETGMGVRYVLVITLVLAIVVLSGLWLIGARGPAQSGQAATSAVPETTMPAPTAT